MTQACETVPSPNVPICTLDVVLFEGLLIYILLFFKYILKLRVSLVPIHNVKVQGIMVTEPKSLFN